MGFTKFQDDVFDALLAADISKRQEKMFLYVLRHTIGWGVEAIAVRPADVVQATGLPRQFIAKAVADLVNLGMLVASDGKVSVQSDVTKWDMVRIVPVRFVPKNGTIRTKERYDSYHQTQSKAPNGAGFETPKDSTDNTDNPLTPKGESAEVPFEVGPYPLRPEEDDLDLEAVFPEAAAEGVGSEVSRADGKPSAPKPSDKPYTPEFEQFWGCRKWAGTKWDAFQAFQKRSVPALDVLLAAVAAQERDRERFAAAPISGDFYANWKHASTWLNKRAWEDGMKFPAAGIVPIATAASSSRESFLTWARGLTSTIGRADDKVRCLVERAAVVDGVAVDLAAAHRVLEDQGLDEAWVWVHRATAAGKAQRRDVANG